MLTVIFYIISKQRIKDSTNDLSSVCKILFATNYCYANYLLLNITCLNVVKFALPVIL